MDSADDWSQSRVQLLRGVESGFSTVRASRQGFLTAAEPYGRITAETRADDDGQATVSLTQRRSAQLRAHYLRPGRRRLQLAHCSV